MMHEGHGSVFVLINVTLTKIKGQIYSIRYRTSDMV